MVTEDDVEEAEKDSMKISLNTEILNSDFVLRLYHAILPRICCFGFMNTEILNSDFVL